MSPAKTVEPFEIPFGTETRVGPKNYYISWGLRSPQQWVQLRGDGWRRDFPVDQRLVILKDDGMTEWRDRRQTARKVIRLMGGRHAGLITAGAIPSSVQSCSQRTKTSTLCFITSSIARSAKRQYLIYSEDDFEVFRTAGMTRCTVAPLVPPPCQISPRSVQR